MSEFWLISIPGEKSAQQAWDNLNSATSKQVNLSVNYRLHIPDLKVGTLDILMALSDDLAKLDTFVEGMSRKVATYLAEVLEEQPDKLQENLLAHGVDLTTYVTRFQWDVAKYPLKQPLRSIAEIIGKQVSQIDDDLKSKASAYNALQNSLQTIERKQIGSLMTRTLNDLVKKEDFVLNSEYLITLLVVVPKASVSDWFAKYETLAQMVVPASSKKLYEDDDHCLFNVTLFQRVVDEYKLHCRENKFIVRDFEYNEQSMAAGKNEAVRLADDKKKQFGPLVRWLKVNFSEAFSAWIHIKVMRLFVESVLRYGLPVNFQAILLHPHRKTSKRLREVLSRLYAHLDNTGSEFNDRGGSSATVEIPGLGFGQSDYYPYVFYSINTDMLEGYRRR